MSPSKDAMATLSARSQIAMVQKKSMHADSDGNKCDQKSLPTMTGDTCYVKTDSILSQNREPQYIDPQLLHSLVIGNSPKKGPLDDGTSHLLSASAFPSARTDEPYMLQPRRPFLKQRWIPIVDCGNKKNMLWFL